jgi:phosphomannomutase
VVIIGRDHHPKLLELMGVEVVNYTRTQRTFPHNPEPLKKHLTDISELVVKEKADLGVVVDPDVDLGFHLRRW